MKTTRIAIAALSLLAISLVTPAFAALPTIAATWQGFTYHGYDPYYRSTITGFKTGSSASLTLSIDNIDTSNYINVTAAKLMLDWNQNVTVSPGRINQLTVMPIVLSFAIPANTVATNLVGHSYSWYINFTGPSQGTHNFYSDGASSSGILWVLSGDQADALAAAQQLPQPIPSFSADYSYCGTIVFRTAEGGTLCQQSTQQADQAWNFYSLADFADAKSSFQAAQSNWNQALSSEKSTGGNLELAGTVQGWGFLLLGIGALVAGLGGILYAWKRPRELRGMTTATTTH